MDAEAVRNIVSMSIAPGFDRLPITRTITDLLLHPGQGFIISVKPAALLIGLQTFKRVFQFHMYKHANRPVFKAVPAGGMLIRYFDSNVMDITFILMKILQAPDLLHVRLNFWCCHRIVVGIGVKMDLGQNINNHSGKDEIS